MPCKTLSCHSNCPTSIKFVGEPSMPVQVRRAPEQLLFDKWTGPLILALRGRLSSFKTLVSQQDAEDSDYHKRVHDEPRL